MNNNASIDLFSPLQVGPYTLPNRMVMAPLTRNRSAAGYVPTELMAEYYAQRASAGLIITEASPINPQGIGYPHTPAIYNNEQVAGWRKVTGAVHAKGGRIFLQLWHVGRISHPSFQPDGTLPVAPSAIKPAGDAFTYQGPQPFVTPRALETSEIPGLIEDYRKAARNAMEAGFDGVEIHGANGYLLDQFLRDGTNQRTDVYGGSLENRARLLLEVTEAVVSVWGPGKVGVRLSPLNPFNDIRDSNPEATFTYVTERLNHYPLAYLHITEWGQEQAGAAGPGFDLARLRRIYNGVYMTNAGYDKARGNAAVAEGKADLIAYGVLFLANPDLPARFAKDAPLNAPDQATFYGGDAKGYTDYPALA